GFVFIDIYRNISSFFAYAKPKFEISSEGLKLTNVPVPTPEEMLAREPYRSKAIDVGVILREKVRWISGINEQRARAITTPILDDVVATTRGIGAVPVFVYMPIYDETQLQSDSLSAHEQYLQRFCEDQGVACLFLRP